MPRPRGAHDRERLVVGDLAGRAPRVDAGGEAALALPHVADAGDRALVEQRLADRARRVVLAQAAQEAPLVELGGEDVRAELGEAPVEARARVGQQLEHGAVELHDLAALGPQDEPRAAGRAAPALAVAVGAPRAGHAQVRVDREAAVEAHEEVLAVGVDARDRAAGELVGPALAAQARARVRDLGHEALDERADAARGVVDRVALGHRAQPRAVQGWRAASVRAWSWSGSSVRRTSSAGSSSATPRSPGVGGARARAARAAPTRSPRSWRGATSATSPIVPVGGRSGLAGGAAVVDERRDRDRARAAARACAASTRCCGGWRPRPA